MKKVQRVDHALLMEAAMNILIAIGEDPARPGLERTPTRFANFWKEFIEYNPGNHETVFESVRTDQLVLAKGLRVWSLCEHHLLPFYADIAIGYLASDRILGLSKFGRIAQLFAHRLQIQEQLVDQIAAEVSRLIQTANVAVLATGEHLCMTMRGIQMPCKFTSSAMLGEFRNSPTLRAEFLELVGHGC